MRIQDEIVGFTLLPGKCQAMSFRPDRFNYMYVVDLTSIRTLFRNHSKTFS